MKDFCYCHCKVLPLGIVIVFAGVTSPRLKAEDMRSLHLDQVESIEVPSSQSIIVRPPGVIEVVATEDQGIYQVKAIKLGQATIYGRQDKRVLWQRKFIVEEFLQKTDNTPEATSTQWPRNWDFCNAPGIYCQVDQRRVYGRTDSFQLRNSILLACRRLRCYSEVQLSKRALQSQFSYYEQRLSALQGLEKISDGARILITANCFIWSRRNIEKQIDFLLDDDLRNGFVGLRCLESQHQANLQVQATVFLAERTQLEEFGTQWQQVYSSFARSRQQMLASYLKDLAQQKMVMVIGQPSAIMLVGSKTKLSSGGEFAIPSQSEFGAFNLNWKGYGIDISLELLSFENQQAVIKFDAQVRSSPEASTSRRLSRNLAEGTLKLPLDQNTVVSSLDFRTQDFGIDGSLILSKVPIVGPLLSQSSQSERYNHLLISILVKAADNDGVPLSGNTAH